MSPFIFDFLEKLRENNNRPWFESNKHDFIKVQNEFKTFVLELLPEAEELYPGSSLIKPEQCIYRIYRDVRFSKNKTPYKTNISASIGPKGRKSGFDSIYLHIENNASFLAAGGYDLLPEQLSSIRQEIDYNSKKLLSIINLPEFVHYFGQIKGNKLKTSPKGYDQCHPDIELLRYTQLYVVHPFSNKEVQSNSFHVEVVEGMRMSKLFTDFLIEATTQPQ